MPELPSRRFDLIFADPPYNNGTHYHADPTRDRLSDRNYLTWCKYWMSECARLLSPSGSLFVLIDDRYSDFFGTVLRSLKDPPLHRHNTIIWWEQFSNHQIKNFSHAARFIHYYTRSEKSFVWNAQDILVPSASAEVYKDSRTKPGGKVPGNVWEIARQTGNKADTIPFDDHPPQIPDKLLRRVILAASNEGDAVFDPFAGNGTTGRAAISLGRKFLGIERSPKYAAQARLWIGGEKS